MLTKTFMGATLALALAAGSAQAAPRHDRAERNAPRADYMLNPSPAPSPRTGPYSHPQGYGGTIHWNTPDANGNFSTNMGAGGGSP